MEVLEYGFVTFEEDCPRVLVPHVCLGLVDPA